MTLPSPIELKLHRAPFFTLPRAVTLLLTALLLGCFVGHAQASPREGYLDLRDERSLLEQSTGDLDGVWVIYWVV